MELFVPCQVPAQLPAVVVTPRFVKVRVVPEVAMPKYVVGARVNEGPEIPLIVVVVKGVDVVIKPNGFE